MMSEGQKLDTGKQQWHAMPLVLLKPLADTFNAGVLKYEKFNCRILIKKYLLKTLEIHHQNVSLFKKINGVRDDRYNTTGPGKN